MSRPLVTKLALRRDLSRVASRNALILEVGDASSGALGRGLGPKGSIKRPTHVQNLKEDLNIDVPNREAHQVQLLQGSIQLASMIYFAGHAWSK
jgi:hypothetical protein